MATAAQNLYDKCPHALRQAMDTLDHNKEAQGYRCDLPQVYADIQACRNSPLLGVFGPQPAQAGAATLSGNSSGGGRGGSAGGDNSNNS
jgi:hypothetical protein